MVLSNLYNKLLLFSITVTRNNNTKNIWNKMFHFKINFHIIKRLYVKITKIKFKFIILCTLFFAIVVSVPL